ncbi:MAG TPA: ATP-binding protein, partial [Tahibacter sp.]|nr:ATP-binding protein [Tahibacter sp.]
MTPDLLARFLLLPEETEYLEFKQNKDDPESVGVYISALSNSAALAGTGQGYLFWGIDDKTHRVVGTNAAPRERRVGNEPLENWLSRLLYPGVNFRFGELVYDDRRVVWLEVQAASHTPVRFRDFEYVRVGQVTKKLRDHPEKERALWTKLAPDGLEKDVVREFASLAEAVAALDYAAYSRLSGNRFTSVPAIGERLCTEGFLAQRPDGGCSITLLGAMLFANDFDHFPSLRRKAPRIVLYRGRGRTD